MKIYNEKTKKYDEEVTLDDFLHSWLGKTLCWIVSIILGIILLASIIMLFYENFIF